MIPTEIKEHFSDVTRW